IFPLQTLEHDDSMSDALELHVTPVGCSVVEEKNRASAIHEKVLEGKDLPAKAKRIACKKPEFRKRIKHDALWFKLLDPVQDVLRRILKLDLRRVEVGVLILRLKVLFGRREFVNLHALKRPPVRLSTAFELSLR